MNNPIQRRPETQELKRQISFWSVQDDETDDGANMSIEDTDTKLGVIVLLLACLALAVLAHMFV